MSRTLWVALVLPAWLHAESITRPLFLPRQEGLTVQPAACSACCEGVPLHLSVNKDRSGRRLISGVLPRSVSLDGAAHHRLHCHVHLGSGRGVLAALEVAGRGHSSWPEAFHAKGVSAAERRALRALLLQVAGSSQKPLSPSLQPCTLRDRVSTECHAGRDPA